MGKQLLFCSDYDPTSRPLCHSLETKLLDGLGQPVETLRLVLWVALFKRITQHLQQATTSLISLWRNHWQTGLCHTMNAAAQINMARLPTWQNNFHNKDYIVLITAVEVVHGHIFSFQVFTCVSSWEGPPSEEPVGFKNIQCRTGNNDSFNYGQNYIGIVPINCNDCRTFIIVDYPDMEKVKSLLFLLVYVHMIYLSANVVETDGLCHTGQCFLDRCAVLDVSNFINQFIQAEPSRRPCECSLLGECSN